MPGNPSLREKWPDRDVYYGCPPGTEVKIGVTLSLPHMSLCHEQGQIYLYL